MIGIYFSGTGNTKYCVGKFLEYYNGSKPISIESPDAIRAIKESKDIVLGYPVYYSDIPKIVRDFIYQNRTILKGKRIFIICTMALFSGDGTGCSSRILKNLGAEIIGGLHLIMPDCIGDVKILKKPLAQNKLIVKKTEIKIKNAVNSLKNGTSPQEGLKFIHRVAGLFGQRLWFYKTTKKYTSKLKINSKLCIGCGKCVDLCPMKNLKMTNQKATSDSKCTMCYRCISHCPNKAITLLGKKVVQQSLIEKYVEK